MYRIIFTISFLLGSLAASAQELKEWTLRQCIDYALANNITVKQQDVTRRQNEVEPEHGQEQPAAQPERLGVAELVVRTRPYV